MHRRLPLLLLVFVATPTAVGKEPSKPFFVNPTSWLVIGPVDGRARRPFNPDAVFERYLLDRRSGVPHEGDTIEGERGKPLAWKRVTADDKGTIGGGVAWAYTRVVTEKKRIVLARLLNGSRLYVNGTPSVGAIYGTGFQATPVVLEKGANDIFVRGVRGRFRLTLEPVPGPLFFAPRPLHLPDLVAGEPIDAIGGVWIVNAQTTPAKGLRLGVHKSDLIASAVLELDETIPPLGAVQVALPIRGPPGTTVPADAKHVDFVFRLEGAPTSRMLRLAVRRPHESILHTFVSRIDDSVQVYGVRRPVSGKEPVPKTGLILSLHGASVPPRAQADAYSSKPDFWIVCPTNRGRYGFDWQDWGRQDAYEVLADALERSGVDRRRVHLTGHSMGGHGTWHLAANDPDGFASIAPSAGWISFDTYGKRPKTTLSPLWHAADAASRTRRLIDNLVQLPTYIVHGTKDDNVPVDQAREMEKLLTVGGANLQVHYAKDKGHWWNGPAAKGADCVDWPGIFEMFRKHEIADAPLDLDFTTVDPGVDARHHWIEVQRPKTYGQPSRVEARTLKEARAVEIKTRNVKVLSVQHPLGYTLLAVDGKQITVPAGERVHLVMDAGLASWVPFEAPPAGYKTPTQSGPFKRAFDRGFVMVYGTKGNEAETRELLERARHDANAWIYRAAGQARVLTDEAYLGNPDRWRGRNVILYGNVDTNAAFGIIRKNKAAPHAARGTLRLAGRSWIGEDLCAMYIYPQADDPDGLVGVFADTGVAGTRLGLATIPFVSGAGYPDYVVFDAKVLRKGDVGVLAAGWFDAAWNVQKGGFLKK